MVEERYLERLVGRVRVFCSVLEVGRSGRGDESDEKH